MEAIRTTIQSWFDRHEKSWRALSLGRQRSYTLCLFLAYLLLTAVVILKVCCGMAKSDNIMAIDPIGSPVRKKESPAFQQDTLSTIIKETINERK